MNPEDTSDPCIYVSSDGRACKLAFGHDGRCKILLDKPIAPERLCVVCQEPASMSSSLGPACPDHYDTLSG
jgi:hypothetical protein